MPRILMIQPDTGQASILMDALRERTDAVVEVVDSKDAAIAAIDSEVPDLVLFHMLMSPEEEDFVVAHLRALSGAPHLQTLTVPLFQTRPSARRRKRRLLAGFSARKVEQGPDPCDTGQFADLVLEYLSRARAIKETHEEEVAIARELSLVRYSAPVTAEAEPDAPRAGPVFGEPTDDAHREPDSAWVPRIEAMEPPSDSEDMPLVEPDMTALVTESKTSVHSTAEAPVQLVPKSDRRRVRRWSRDDVPHVLGVQLSTESADLINISSTGVLLRTHIRPPLDVLGNLRSDREGSSRLVFHVRSGTRVSSARVVRCQVASITDGKVLYDVAFRFDDSPGLELPDGLAVDGTSGEGAISAGISTIQPETRQLVTVRDSTTELAAVDAALLQIRLMLRRARRHGVAEAELRDLKRRLAPRIRELRGLRAMFLGRLDRDAGGVLPATS